MGLSLLWLVAIITLPALTLAQDPNQRYYLVGPVALNGEVECTFTDGAGHIKIPTLGEAVVCELDLILPQHTKWTHDAANPVGCTVYCDAFFMKMKIHTPIIYTGRPPVFIQGGYTTQSPLLSGNCVAVDYICEEYVDPSLPINQVSMRMYGDLNEKHFALTGDFCYEDTPQCNLFIALRALRGNAEGLALFEKNNTLSKLIGTSYSCMLPYFGMGAMNQRSTCWLQMLDQCFGLNGIKICNDRTVKDRGVTNFKASSNLARFSCLYTSHAYKNRRPYGFDFRNPPLGIEACDFIVYTAALTINNEFDTCTWDRALTSKEHIDQLTFLNSKYTVFVAVTIPGAYANLGLTVQSHVKMESIVKACLFAALSTGAKGVVLAAPTLPATGSIKEAMATFVREFAVQIKYSGTRTYLGYNFDSNSIQLDSHPLSEIQNFVDHYYPTTYGFRFRRAQCHTPWRVGSFQDSCTINTCDRADASFAKLLYATIKLRINDDNKIFYAYSPRGYPSDSTSSQVRPLNVIQNEFSGRCVVQSTTECCTFPYTDPTTGARNTMIYQGTESMIAQYEDAFRDLGITNGFIADWTDAVLNNAANDITAFINSVKVAFDTNSITAVAQNLTGLNVDIVNALNSRRRSENIVFGAPPTYSIGFSNGAIDKKPCDEVLANFRDLIFTGVAYQRFFQVPAHGVFVARIQDITVCRVTFQIVEPLTKAPLEDFKYTVNMDSFSASSNPNHFLVGLTKNDTLAYYEPELRAACQEVNSEPTTRLPYVEIADELYITEPEISPDQTMVYIPDGWYYLMDNYTLTVDYINFHVECVNFDPEKLPSCLSITCAGNPDCIIRYGSLCTDAEVTRLNLMRSNELVKSSLKDLGELESRAKLYADTETSISQRPKRAVLGVIALGVAAGAAAAAGAAIYIAKQASARIDILDQRQSATERFVENLGGQVVEISRKLDYNINAVNNRVDQLQNEMNQRFDAINSNFDKVQDEIANLARDAGSIFQASSGYNSWSETMHSYINQQNQAAMQMGGKVTRIMLCMQSLENLNLENCPVQSAVLQDYPGLASSNLVQALLYENRKLFIVSSVPQNLIPMHVVRAVPLPIMINGVQCWPAYDMVLINGETYQVPECTQRYCREIKPHPDYDECRRDVEKCRVVCGRCYKGVCYDKGKVSYEKIGDFNVTIPVTLAEFNPVTITTQLNSSLWVSVLQQLEEIRRINTTVVLRNVTTNIDKLEKDLDGYRKTIEELNALYKASQAIDSIGVITLAVILGVVALWLGGITYYMVKKNRTTKNGYSMLVNR